MRLLQVLALLLAASVAGAQERYRVTLAVLPGDDVSALATQLSATYGARVEAVSLERAEAVITATESRAGLLSASPHVRNIETLGAGSTWTTGNYQYDGSNNIRQIGFDTYVYDSAGRVVSGTAGQNQRQDYGYDAFGNLLTITTNGSTATQIKLHVNPETNRASTPTQSSVQFNAFGDYDGAGNMLSFGTARFAYDGLGMITDSTVDGRRTLYLYTPDEERVASITVTRNAQSQWVEGQSEWTLRGADQKVLRRFFRSGSGTWTWDEDYIYRRGLLLAAEVNGPEKTLRFHLDHLGTPRLITGNGGAEVSRHDYYPFGHEAAISSSSREQLKFTGHERDHANVDYMHARYYNPGWGRFLSVDPYLDLKKATRNPQSWNRYSYVRNKPINLIDPDGRDDVNLGPDFAVAGAANPEKDRDYIKALAMASGGYLSLAIATVVLDPGPELGDGELPKVTTKPTLPDKPLATDGKVTIEHYYKSGDHPPAHAHVRGGGPDTRIGPNGKPATKADAPMTRDQQKVYDSNKSRVRRAINKIGRWLAAQVL